MRPARALRSAGVALVLAAATLLGGCATIPTQGQVQIGTTQNPDAPNDVAFVPSGPPAGASQADIVNGFVLAATGPQGDYAIAREFLTAAFAKQWNAKARVLIQNARARPVTAAPNVLSLAVPTLARVDRAGVYASYPTVKTTPVQFEFAKVNGQWRIARTADGIVLGKDYFTRLFTSRALYYLDRTSNRVVPDLRWFPNRVTRRPEDAVAALLAGQAPPIASPVTVTAFPPGTRAGDVRVAPSGVATVDLRTGPAIPPEPTLRRMRLQLEQTLRGLDGITSVQLSLNGRLVLARPLQRASSVANPAPLVYRSGVFGYLAGNRVTAEGPFAKNVAWLKPSAVTTSARQGFAAALAADGVHVVTASARLLVDRRPQLIAPTIDAGGWTYSVPQDHPQELLAFDVKGHRQPVRAEMPGLESIESIEIARDGTRMLVLGLTPDGPRSFVAGIERDGRGAPVSLTTAVYGVTIPEPSAVDATWVSDGSVAVLTRGSDGDQVTLQTLGGDVQALGRLSGSTALVGAASEGSLGQDELRALLSTGAIYEPRGSRWGPSGGTADVLAIQR
ncbi:MAG: hypothetical protein QOC59_672 [Microbacteriaceae bacterium]|nr:hypothetical protein [Microbacteriaceae bacterium]